MTTETTGAPGRAMGVTTGAAGRGVKRGASLRDAGLAALLGLGLVWLAGFAGADALHAAAHDTRHSTGFPCH